MAGGLFDLTVTTSLPDEFLVDTNILLAGLYPQLSNSRQVSRAKSVIMAVQPGSMRIGYVSPVSMQEFFHVYLMAVLRSRVRQSWGQYAASIQKVYPSINQGNVEGRHLLKVRPGEIRHYATDFARIVAGLNALNLYLMQPHELGWDPVSHRYEEELHTYMVRYKCDSSDAALLLDAHRSGISSIVSLDRDFRNAKSKFDVYTWL